MASYGKMMVEAAKRQQSAEKHKATQASVMSPGIILKEMRQKTSSSRCAGQLKDPLLPVSPSPEKDRLDKVSKWLDTCPDNLSEETENQTSSTIPPSVVSKTNDSPFPALQLHNDNDSMEDKDYQPSSDDEDSMDFPKQTFNETSSGEMQLVSHAISRNGSVVLNKKQYCYYCDKPQLKLARHLTSLHQNESTVAQVIAKKITNPKKYKLGLKRLKCLGNFVHNVKTLKQKNVI